jgi:hypothetical protein
MKLKSDGLKVCAVYLSFVVFIVGSAYFSQDPLLMQWLLTVAVWLIKIAIVGVAALIGWMIGIGAALKLDRDVAGAYYAIITIPMAMLVMIGLAVWLVKSF